jgi:hypothetical protein
MILLNDVVHVLRWPAPAVPAQRARLLQLSDGGRVSWMAIHIDDSRPDLPRTQRKPKKAFGRNQIPVRRQQKVDCVSRRINGAV